MLNSQPLKNKTMWTQSPAAGIRWNYSDDVKSALILLQEKLYEKYNGVDEVMEIFYECMEECFPDLFKTEGGLKDGKEKSL